ncbi:TPA: heme ABC exporter ATP-binding protein CcmA [Escherichia coli]
MLEARELLCERDERTLFSGLSFTLNAGEWVQITGSNGAGKTTLLRLLTGLSRPDAGDVLWQGQPLHQVRDSYHQNLLWIGHQPGIKTRLTALENLHSTFSYWGMVAAHLGLAVTIVGIAFSQNYSVERDVRMKSGDSVDIHEYRFTFRDVKEVTGPNWRGGVATIGVTRDGKPETVLYAEKRYYNTAGSMMTEAAIDGGITRDLYAALGEELENGAWAVRLYYKPFVRWIWAGGLMMALGGLLCLFDPRYRKRVSPQKTAPEAV